MAEMDIWSLGVEGNVRVTNTIHNPQIIGFDERIKREFDEGKELLEFC
ncbi:MAG: hypothetical protein ACOX1T_00205 [Saccharofermentanales bacterium]